MNKEVLNIIKSFGFSEVFPRQVIIEADRASATPVGAEGRQDFRNLLTVTIDGDDAKDLDDAITLIKTDSGYTLYVHIADVSHYVRNRSALDKEAYTRGTSVYFPNGVIPMLPKTLSNGICSLSEGADRLCLTAVINVDGRGEVTAYNICESVIRSDMRMTYANVTKMLNGEIAGLSKDISDNIVKMIFDMDSLAKILNKKRAQRGAINFESKESVIVLNKAGKPIDIKLYPYEVSNAIIEEFMLLANETVAEFIAQTGCPFIYRAHEKPSEEKIKELQEFLTGLGYNLNVKGKINSQAYQKCLEHFKDSEVFGIVNRKLLRSMQKAKYDVRNLGHFGLAAKHYCHFTAPIRRYPDLIVHRILKAFIGGNGATLGKMRKFCQEAAAQSSERERASEQASWAADDYYKAYYMESRIGEEYDGIVSGVTGFGVFVELDNTVEGLARLEWLPHDRYVYDEKAYTLRGHRHSYRLGDKVRIRVDAANRVERRVAFSILP
jgi:ribonuclease R